MTTLSTIGNHKFNHMFNILFGDYFIEKNPSIGDFVICDVNGFEVGIYGKMVSIDRPGTISCENSYGIKVYPETNNLYVLKPNYTYFDVLNNIINIMYKLEYNESVKDDNVVIILYRVEYMSFCVQNDKCPFNFENVSTDLDLEDIDLLSPTKNIAFKYISDNLTYVLK